MPRPPMDTPSKVQIDKRNGHDKTGQASLSPTLGQYRIKYHLVNGGLLDTDGIQWCCFVLLLMAGGHLVGLGHPSTPGMLGSTGLAPYQRGDDLVLACTVLEQ